MQETTDIIEVCHSNNYVAFAHIIFLQEIISEEIVDETDQYEDNRSKKRVRRHTSVRSQNG